MKTLLSKTALIVITSGFLPLHAQAIAEGKTHALVSDVFIAEQGFDDNDQVEAVVNGHLPNHCHLAGETKVEIDNGQKKIRIEQEVILRDVKICHQGAEDRSRDSHPPVRFSKTVIMGQLDKGTWSLSFHSSETGQESVRRFEIARASSDSIDELTYAPVTRAFIPEIFYETADAQVVLSGAFSQSCEALDEIQVKNLGDVIVLLPTSKRMNAQRCRGQIRPLERVISIGALRAGRYLLHVRTMNGTAINQVFEVIGRPIDPRMGDSSVLDPLD